MPPQLHNEIDFISSTYYFVDGENGCAAEIPCQKITGSKPAEGRYKSIPVPFWFNDKSADAFRTMRVRPDDVILSSLPKSGTTWVHKILHSLMHMYDEDGSKKVDKPNESSIRTPSPIYPDCLPLNQEEQKQALEEDCPRAKFVEENFGNHTFEDLINQPEPRLLSTHLFGRDFLPLELLGNEEEEGTGRLVIVLRNLKDAMCSLHFFQGEAKDGWLGNEHGPGSFNRFIDSDCPNAFGSSFDWIKQSDHVVRFLQEQAAKFMKRERVLIVYYEALKADLPAQLDRINDFLGLSPLTTDKRVAVAKACGFSAMKNGNMGWLANAALRKGIIGDWRNHLNKSLSEEFDRVFAHHLGDVPIAEPLRHFQWWEVPGMPPLRRAEWTLDTDPRTWPVFDRIKLVDGMVVPDTLFARNARIGGRYLRPSSECDGKIPSDKYAAEAGRYHLFVSGICPWASSAATARHLLGLEDVISMDIADGQSGAGWTFLDGASAAPWKDRPGPFWIHEAYQLDNSRVSARVTVPVLWDTKTNTIVSNDSWTIIKIFSEAFAGMGSPPQSAASLMAVDGAGHPTLFPEGIDDDIENCQSDLYNALLNGVYKAGVGLMISHEVETKAILSAREAIYDKLSDLEELFSKQRFLMGDKLTAPDIRLAMNLIRWDCSYRDAFVLKGGRGGVLIGDGYPSVKAFVRDMYSVVSDLVDFPAIRQYYRIRQAVCKASQRCMSPHDVPVLSADEAEEKEGLSPLPDLREILESAQEPAGLRPGM